MLTQKHDDYFSKIFNVSVFPIHVHMLQHRTLGLTVCNDVIIISIWLLNSFNGQENVNTTICIFVQLKSISINLVNNPLKCLYTINSIIYTTTFYLITLIQLVVGGWLFSTVFW